ncbi:alpha/beta fold hydrolase [Pseudomonas sp. SLFW]|uniref:alpha/beta fold hydrolase n=1 Tax=Pseudomonas sp. SLFW TaxID=2683259 RepID=UPI0014133307|nr:alpha/beta hydrolase [Pseudomonas sp. SLFW]NBB09825.1 alpha/beta fold hydrolase [Pseudomonas sp. SLFW]
MSLHDFQTADGCRLAYTDQGSGLTVLWQHGLGADHNQPAEVFPSTEGIRRITLECRGHGASELGDTHALSIAQFANDALALLDHLEIERAVFGGISLGAAVALRLAVTHPQRAAALILARPAWIAENAPHGMKIYREVARLLHQLGPQQGALRFEASPLLHEIAHISPDNAASLRSFFNRDPISTVPLLNLIPDDGPGVSISALQALTCPTQIIANRQDFIHSMDTAETLAGLISQSRLSVIASKTLSREQYLQGFREVLNDFLTTTLFAG